MYNVKDTVVQRLATLIMARLNCTKSGNINWQDRHESSIETIIKENLPSGSGIDGETTIDYEKSKPDRIVIDSSYHVMDENGMYAGWVDYRVIITPSLQFGFESNIIGNFSGNRDAAGVKDYLYEIYEHALSEVI